MADVETSSRKSLEDVVGKDDFHGTVVDWFETSVDALSDGFEESCKDRDYHDGFQHTQEEISDLAKRGQPVVTSNRIERKVDYIRGTEMRQRVDPHAYPAGMTGVHEDEANAATDALRALDDKERFDWTRSDAFENLCIEGTCGGLVDVEVVGDEREIRVHHIEWERLIWDYRSKRPDFRDARWVGTATWMDIDEAIDLYPSARKVLEQSAYDQPDESNDNYSKKPQRWHRSDTEEVRLFHCFYRRRGDWWECIATKAGWVVPPARTVFRDDRGRTYCRLILQSARVTRTTEDRPAQRKGLVRTLISPQDQINKRESKQLHLLTMAQIHSEEGAILMGPEEALEEVAKPDGYIPYSVRAIQEGRVRIDRNVELGNGQAMLLQQAKMEIDSVGPTSPVMGADDRVRSGRAELARQQAGTSEVEPLFDALRRWDTRMYEAKWWSIRQFWPEERWLRVRDANERVGFRFVSINRRMTRSERFRELLAKSVPLHQAIQSVGMPPVVAQELFTALSQAAQQQLQMAAMQMQQRGVQIPEEAMQGMMEQAIIGMLSQHPLMKSEFKMNDLSQLRTDIVVDTTPDTAVVQQEEFDKLSEAARSGVPIPPEALIRASQLRNKQEILQALSPPPDPVAQQVAMVQLQLLEAEVKKTEAEAMDEMASAQERMANAQFKMEVQPQKTQADAMKSAAEAGSLSTPLPGPGGVPQ